MNHDDKGRMQSLTYNPGDTSGYLKGVSYNIAGQITGLTLGNGVAETFGYDPQRMQLTSQTATKGAASLMNLTYGYQAPAGQMGAGSTAGNAGQVMTISGTINSTAESAAYSYDNLGRLVTSDQTANGSSAQRKFGYDRWGNRGAVYDAVSGGTLIQNVALEQSGGAPTNRISALSTPGWFGTYTYDAAGNVTNDGAHAYQYDAENRLVKVDNGATAQYKYDHQNRRVSKIIGSSWTHYVWQGGQVIGEHNATTAYTTNPTYQVNSARLDFIYFGSQRIYSRERASSGGTWTTKYYLSDRLSTRVVLNTSGNVLGRQGHLPFGEDFGESGTQEKHHFTSYERDSESGLDYAVNRGYSFAVGRFLSVDQQVGNISKPQRLNRYVYTRNNPVNRTDRLGLDDGDEDEEEDGWDGVPEWYSPIIDAPSDSTSISDVSADPKPAKWSKEKCEQGLALLRALANTLNSQAKAILDSIASVGGGAGAEAAEIRDSLSGLESLADGIPPDNVSHAARRAQRLGRRTGALTVGLPGFPLDANTRDRAERGIEEVNEVIQGFADLYNHCNMKLEGRDRRELDELKDKVNGFSSIYRNFYNGILQATNSGPI